VHLFISLLLRGLIISKCSLKMSGKVREFDDDWRLAALSIVSSVSSRMVIIVVLLTKCSCVCSVC